MPHMLAKQVFAACVVLSVAKLATAQCTGEWVAGSGTPGFTLSVSPSSSRFVGRMMTWDPDGTGPQPEVLIAAGTFSEAFGVPANNVAAWDGSSWRALGAGANHTVQSLTEFQDELVVGGQFTSAGGVAASHVAAWNGRSWRAFGAGLPSLDVHGLATFNGDLIASNGYTVNRWNGTVWQTIGTASSPIYGLGVYRNELIAIGDFQTIGGVQAAGVAAWNGQSWRSLGTNSGSIARGITEYRGELIVVAGAVRAWNGSTWRVLGPNSPDGRYLGVYHEDLIVGGDMRVVGGVPTYSGLSRWNEVQGWRAFPVAFYTFDSIQEFRGDLCIGGHIYQQLPQYSAFVRWSEPAICAADFDCSGSVGVSDIFAFVNAFLSADPIADFNRSGGINVVDLFDFVRVWYSGCND